MTISDKWRVHSSPRPFEKMLPVTQDDNKRRPMGKPLGLWYGFGDSWLELVRRRLSNSPTAKNKYLYRFEINPSRVLIVKDISVFAKEYKGELFPGQGHSYFIEDGIDWKKVAAKWGGIEIPEYQWGFRSSIDHMWYCGWDCASGCLWDPAALISFERINERSKHAKRD